MQKKPKISVLMSAYNHENFVERAVISVLNQSFIDFEFLIVDDCSNDKTAAILEQLAQKDSRIKLFLFSKNKGACCCVNFLFKKSSGKYISIINSDDEFAPEKLATQFIYMQKNKNVAACFSWVKIIDENSDELPNNEYNQIFNHKSKTRCEYLKHFFESGNCLCHPSILARKYVYSKGLDERLCKLPDFNLWIQVVKNKNIHLIEKPLLYFRILKDQKNASAPCASTLIAVALENQIILKNFENLSKKDCYFIFGQTGNKTIRKYIAFRAALLKCESYQAWGIFGLYALLKKQKFKTKLLKKKFSVVDLNLLSKKLDIYKIIPHTSELFFKSSPEHYFCQKNSLCAPYCSNVFSESFEINNSICCFRFDPSKKPCKVYSIVIKVCFENSQQNIVLKSLQNFQTNCSESNFYENSLVFNHCDSNIVIDLKKTAFVKSINISCIIDHF